MNDKVAVITGGSDGLGKATAKRLVTAGCKVIILSPTEEKLKATASELGCEYRVCDVSDEKQVDLCIKEIAATFKKIDFLINSAGVWIEGELTAIDPEKIRRIFEVNTLGTIFMCQAVIPFMRTQGSGVILNVVSQAGLNVKANRSIYNSSKWAVTGFTRCLELDLSSVGIKVVGLYPSMMKTGLFAAAGVAKDTSKGLDVNEVAKAIEFALSSGPETEISAIEIKYD